MNSTTVLPETGVLVAARQLRKVHRGSGGRQLGAVDGIDLDIRRAEAFGVLGANGAGKSSLIRLSLIHISEPTRPY